MKKIVVANILEIILIFFEWEKLLLPIYLF